MNSSGWTTNEVFTIPGTAIGGASPADDLVFGVNADETSEMLVMEYHLFVFGTRVLVLMHIGKTQSK